MNRIGSPVSSSWFCFGGLVFFLVSWLKTPDMFRHKVNERDSEWQKEKQEARLATNDKRFICVEQQRGILGILMKLMAI